MKKHEIIFSIIKVPCDFLLVLGAFFLAKQIRAITDGIPGVHLPIQTISNQSLISYAIAGAFLYVFIFSIHKLYSLSIVYSKIQEIIEIIRYSIYWFLFFSVGVYLGNGIFYNIDEIPRLIIAFTLILNIIGSICIRIILNIFQKVLLQYGVISKRKLIIFTGANQDEINSIVQDIELAKVYTIMGYIHHEDTQIQGLPYIGTVDDFENIAQKRGCDEILIAKADLQKTDILKIWELSRIFGIRYRYITNNFEINQSKTELGLIYKIPVIEILNTPLQNWAKVGKRVFDISASFFLLILSSPLLILIAILIKIEDPQGPIIYKNLRIGQNGNLFHCYKFRYIMWKYCTKESYGVPKEHDTGLKFETELIATQNSRAGGPLYKIKDDPRKTKIGAFLEKYSLDEIPQLINVFLGEMSLVGPRPHQPREVEGYSLSQKRLLTIKPGITGMAQVNGREKNDFEKEANLDIFYIENWSFLLDLKILLKTITIILQRK